jgi:hypothetical protein
MHPKIQAIWTKRQAWRWVPFKHHQIRLVIRQATRGQPHEIGAIGIEQVQARLAVGLEGEDGAGLAFSIGKTQTRLAVVPRTQDGSNGSLFVIQTQGRLSIVVKAEHGSTVSVPIDKLDLPGSDDGGEDLDWECSADQTGNKGDHNHDSILFVLHLNDLPD